MSLVEKAASSQGSTLRLVNLVHDLRLFFKMEEKKIDLFL